MTPPPASKFPQNAYCGDTHVHTGWSAWDKTIDGAEKTVYYVRVLEIPTPRCTLYDKIRFGDQMDEKVPLTHQERAFTSPIWYMP